MDKTRSSASSASSKPIVIDDALAAKCDGPDQFKKFDALFRKVVAVPKVVIDKAEAEWKQDHQKRAATS